MLLRWIVGSVLLAALVGLALWGIFRTIKNSADPTHTLFKWIITAIIAGIAIAAIATKTGNSFGGAFIVPFVCVFIGVVMSIMWAPQIGGLLAKPLTSAIDGGDAEPVPQPLYSIAIAKRKRGLYREAVYEIQRQLSQFPTDVTGQLLLAEIQADDLSDLDAAQFTLERFVNQPDHTPKNIACAYNLLADWRLKHLLDAEAARQALQQLIDRLPDTDFAHAATQRMTRLGDDAVAVASRESTPIKLRPGVRNIGLIQDPSTLKRTEPSPESVAQDYLRRLADHPNDNETRVELALLYAQQMGRVDLATGELETLLAQPGLPPAQAVHWLNLIADMQIKLEKNEPAARNALERIIELFPDRASAQLARNRLNLLPLELKAQQKSRTVTLGSYEKNIGLKSAVTAPGARRRSQRE